VIALLFATAKANWMMYRGAMKSVSTWSCSGHPRELAWYHEAGDGGPEKAPDATSDRPCADTQRVRSSRSDVRTMLAHRVSSQASRGAHYGLQLPEEERGHISGKVIQRLGRDPPDVDGRTHCRAR
jgi:hypothetical protein